MNLLNGSLEQMWIGERRGKVIREVQTSFWAAIWESAADANKIMKNWITHRTQPGKFLWTIFVTKKTKMIMLIYMNIVKDVKDHSLLLFILEPEKIMATLYENRKENSNGMHSSSRPSLALKICRSITYKMNSVSQFP